MDEMANVTRVRQTRVVQRRQQLLTPDIIDTVDWHCYSAPQSRSGSFKKSRRRSVKDSSPRSSLPSLEDSITAKLLELQQLEADNYRVVREFVTSARGGIVNRGDSFRRNKETETDAGTTTERRTEEQTDRSRQKQAAGAAATQRGEVGAQQIAADMVACKVVIVGDRGVGKTSLLQQLMTSHYMAAMNTYSFDAECEKTMSVLVDNVETLVHFIDVDVPSQQIYEQDYSDVDGFILLYSVTDRKSYSYVANMLTSLQRHDRYSSTAVILVANKTDLVRKRQVADREAKDLCSRRACKFISISAILNHRVDDLLVGVVCQIRLHRTSTSPAAAAAAATDQSTPSGGTSWLQRLLHRRPKDSPRQCENLLVL